MSLRLVFRRVAQIEFDEAAAWYEVRRDGLGIEFVAEIQKVLDTVRSHPNRYHVVFGDVREARARRFPYCVYYRVKPDRIVILAVFHTSRDPAVWQSRA